MEKKKGTRMMKCEMRILCNDAALPQKVSAHTRAPEWALGEKTRFKSTGTCMVYNHVPTTHYPVFRCYVGKCSGCIGLADALTYRIEKEGS